MINGPVIEVIRRKQTNVQTIGTCAVLLQDVPVFSSVSLEPGWNNNLVGKSCIPKGVYKIVWEYSKKYDRYLWEVKGVDGRSEVKFHPLNYYFDSEGCFGLGVGLKDLNRDGYLDITQSGNAINAFHIALDGFRTAKLIVKGNEEIN